MDRRSFLKICASLIGGIVLARMFPRAGQGPKSNPDLKEARFYKRAGRLAG